MANPISIRGVGKRYGSFVALKDVSLEVGAGEFVTLLGPSGSGKTTLLMILAGFIRPDSGSIQVSAQELLGLPPHRRDIGVVFQNYALFPNMNVEQNVAFPLKLRKVPSEVIVQKVKDTLQLVQLSGLAARRIDQLSGGQRQRVALARAIVFEPKILLMDEPLSALDKKLREEMQVEIKQLHRRIGTTTIYVTHDQREALTLSDKVAVMKGGEILQLADPKQIYEEPSSRFVADFIGETRFVRLDMSNGSLRFQGRKIKTSKTHPNSGGTHFLAARPERVAVSNGDANESNVFQGTAKSIQFVGDSVIVDIELPDGQMLTMRQSSALRLRSKLPQVGAAISVTLHPDDAVIIVEDE